MQEQQLTTAELTIINLLKSLSDYERVTIRQMVTFTNINERSIYSVLNALRSKGYHIVSSKKKSDSGTRFARNEAEWLQYLNTRKKETQSHTTSIANMSRKKGE